MPRRPGLGRGLEALIPAEDSPSPAGVAFIPVAHVAPNPRQPRADYDPGELSGLADSIRQHGVLQPIIVTYDDDSGQYTLIAGQRRLLAAIQAGLGSIPAIIRAAGEQQRLELALIENLQREDLNALEAAEAYRQLAEDFKLSHEEISTRVGKSRAAVTNTLRLLKLPESVRSALREGRISEGHARALLALPTPQSQAAALHSILERGLSVRQTEELVRRLSGQKPSAPARASPTPEMAALEERLRARLGTRVRLNPRSKGGTLVIHYYSAEELDAVVLAILGENAAED
ncbi:MAG: ParB/RepB/Spo0J family partition protein [Chloroflexi bacterium]|nr:ParB/RepB/Spo0J family partition protein [Chloroflexota bacterium]